MQQVNWHITPPQGLYWRASTPIQRCTLILTESPTVTLTQETNGSDVISAINGLSPANRTYFDSLPIGSTFFGQDQNIARFFSNAFRRGTLPSLQGGADVKAYGFFPLGRRFYASCTPNVHAHWHMESGTIEFRAVRNIAAQEPLSISYDIEGILLSCQTRQQRLSQRRGMICGCHICNTPDTTVSDGRRNQITPVVQAQQADIQRIIDAVNSLHQEGLYLFEDTLSYDIYSLASRMNGVNPQFTMSWLRHAYETVRAITGDDDPRVRRLRALGGF